MVLEEMAEMRLLLTMVCRSKFILSQTECMFGADMLDRNMVLRKEHLAQGAWPHSLLKNIPSLRL